MEPLEKLAEELFGDALDLPRGERAAFLDRSCRGDVELRRRVDFLLAENDRLSGFLADPIFGNASAGDASAVENVVRQAAGSMPTPRRRAPLPAGTRLGRYSIIEPLGAGGMGVVYRARDEKLERTVALKMLAEGVLTGEDERRFFRREALALAKLNHPNIAAVYDVGEQDGVDFIVMELVQGESLATKLRGGVLGVREATTIVLQVAEALEEAHAQGVVHRDLKPANVMITPRGHAKVLDFGLAKLLAGTDTTAALAETRGLMGTPLYMSPEQALGKGIDGRTDLWSLGGVYYECLTGSEPFVADSGLAVLRAITDDPLKPLRALRPDAPEQAGLLAAKAMEKDLSRRYQTAAEMAHDAAALLLQLSGAHLVEQQARAASARWWWVPAAAVLVICVTGGWWAYSRILERRWAREEAVPMIEQLVDEHKAIAASVLLRRARVDLPDDRPLRKLEDDNTEAVTVTSEPPGATVSIQDYVSPDGKWLKLGATPLNRIVIPTGYFRWKAEKDGVASMFAAHPSTGLDFSFTAAQKAPPGMVFDPGAKAWSEYIGFLGWLKAVDLPPAYVDRYEVTNKEYQAFVDSGGYRDQRFWPRSFEQNGRNIPWAEEMAQFRDTTGRPGPSTWAGGHYPDGKGDFPVSGVSWFEASAYAAYAGKTLPTVSQFYQIAPPDAGEYIVPKSNVNGSSSAAAGSFNGLGPWGTYDTAGNVREWIANTVDDDLRFILGGSWSSQPYLYSTPEALSPFDRTETNGFRCVKNLGPLPAEASAPFHTSKRDFAKYKPASDAVFNAYRAMYAYQKTPLDAKVEGVVKETADWREEKVTFTTAYNDERMAAFLFLPKRVKPPYQTVLFFPSARVYYQPDSSHLGDIEFFDYVVQSGRAVMYPVYEDTYERRLKHSLPGGSQPLAETIDWYRDAARSLDYLDTRNDIDNHRLAFMGVSMGAADGVIIATMLQDRLSTAVFLDGGYFLQDPPAGGDQADFVPRMKKPVLMVNGRWDYTFSVEFAQNPMFDELGTPAADKSHVILNTPHDVTEDRPRLMKAVLDWLDKYLGRVQL